MSSRSKACEFDEKTRLYIKRRDHNKCVICGNKNNLQIMHIFINRSHGGLGVKENGCLGCIRCHRIIDNPIGRTQNAQSKELLAYCKQYLIDKENIVLNNDFLKSIKYNRFKNY